MSSLYPFSAIVDQGAMKTALLLNAVDPAIGGVLIRGQKGTGKSTAARALAALLPPIEAVAGCPYHCPPDREEEMHPECLERRRAGEDLPRTLRPTPLVELPLSATEDRLVGTLHVEQALRTGERVFEPGLLAAANRGILYVDEVNLLEDHLVDTLLDAAASGVNVVEREGISHTHPARFMLIGTMNPEEGELRPQFLDRFGLCLTVRGLDGVAARREVARRRIAFDRDPREFTRVWAEAERRLGERIRLARLALPAVQIPEEAWDLTVRLTAAAEVQGHRADIAIVRAAAALAALTETGRVTALEVAEAARFVLPHRIHRSPLQAFEDGEREIEKLIARETAVGAGSGRAAGQTAPEEEEAGLDPEAVQVPGSAAAGSILLSYLKKKLPSPGPRPDR